MARFGDYELFSAQDLRKRDTIRTSQTDDLKSDGDDVRYWLSRMTPEDGAPARDIVTIERYNRRKSLWEIALQYDGNTFDLYYGE